MNKSKLHSEIHNGIMYLLSKNITKEKLQSTVELLIDEYHEGEVKKLKSNSLLVDDNTKEMNDAFQNWYKCPSCDGRIIEDSEYCSNCGVKVHF